MSGARLALKMLAPTIFLSGILGTFRGYFQAYRNMLPTSLSQIVEQCFVAVFAILMSTVMLNRLAMQRNLYEMHGGPQEPLWVQVPE
ncbi:MAG: hypothetical protein V8Q57_01200 [Blautia sp.]